MIHVLIISPGVAIRVGLRTLLMDEPRIQIIGEAATPGEVEPGQIDADVQIWSPGGSVSGDRFASELGNLLAGELTAVLIIHDDPKVISGLAGMKMRAWGLLPPEASKEELIAAIEAVNEGLVVTNPDWLEYLSDGQAHRSDEKSNLVETLTSREIEILQLLAQGLTNKQIALNLGISTHTVKFHVSSIFGKMGTTNRTETVKRGLQEGLILL